jgi:hypothetical protein
MNSCFDPNHKFTDLFVIVASGECPSKYEATCVKMQLISDMLEIVTDNVSLIHQIPNDRDRDEAHLHTYELIERFCYV